MIRRGDGRGDDSHDSDRRADCCVAGATGGDLIEDVVFSSCVVWYLAAVDACLVFGAL